MTTRQNLTLETLAKLRLSVQSQSEPRTKRPQGAKVTGQKESTFLGRLQPFEPVTNVSGSEGKGRRSNPVRMATVGFARAS